MAYEQKDNTGSLWKNDRKEKDTHADYRGSIRIEGKDYWLDAWVNEDKNGKKYLGLKTKPKDGTAERPSSQPGPKADKAKSFAPDLDDSVPF